MIFITSNHQKTLSIPIYIPPPLLTPNRQNQPQKTTPLLAYLASILTPKTRMLNTKLLKDAAAAAKTQEERYICINLANSISDGSPFAWKMYYSGEAATLLSRKSFTPSRRLLREPKNLQHTSL